ncbi:MAG: helix-turn-helix domain-containing protein [Chloroflexi bacterium]|nr:MAG: helix-turn-helix domain-containing protein [Chloroflexota bacterium]
MRILPFRLPERSALLAVCLSAASTQCVGKLHYEEARSALAVGTRENMKENSGSNRRNFLTTNEAAQRLGVSYYTVYEYIREKRLVAEMVSGVYIIPEKAVEEFKAKPTGRTRVNPPPWRVYRAGAKVRGLDIHVQALPDQQEPLMEKFHLMLEQQQHLFHGTMQRYIFEEENDPSKIIISLIWKDTELPDEQVLHRDLDAFKTAFAGLLNWDTAQYTMKRAIIHT